MSQTGFDLVFESIQQAKTHLAMLSWLVQMYKTPPNIILQFNKKKKKVCTYVCISTDLSPWDSMSFLISICRMVTKSVSAPVPAPFQWRKTLQDVFTWHSMSAYNLLFCSKLAVRSRYQTQKAWPFWELSVHSAQHTHGWVFTFSQHRS